MQCIWKPRPRGGLGLRGCWLVAGVGGKRGKLPCGVGGRGCWDSFSPLGKQIAASPEGYLVCARPMKVSCLNLLV